MQICQRPLSKTWFREGPPKTIQLEFGGPRKAGNDLEAACAFGLANRCNHQFEERPAQVQGAYRSAFRIDHNLATAPKEHVISLVTAEAFNKTTTTDGINTSLGTAAEGAN